ncbi:MAG: hypothetical protein ABI472_09840 [Ginsengibacter sp.]
MMKFENNWWLYFVPECYFDTVLLKKLLKTNKRLMHRKGCNNVVRDLESPRLKNLFAVALIDKDKTELNYLRECKVLYNADKLILWKHEKQSHFIIQLNPPLEKWTIDMLDENKLTIEDFGYSRNYKKLKKEIKDDIDKEDDEKLNKLLDALVKTDCSTIKKLKSFLIYLKEKNNSVDINELLNA